MAHGLEARVPFLSRDMLALALRIPMEWKLLGEDGQEQAQEKALLREAFAGWLPDEILWRRKEQFGDGSGTADVMARQAARLVPDEDWEQVQVPGLPEARSREELAYQRIFADAPRRHPRRAGARPLRHRLSDRDHADVDMGPGHDREITQLAVGELTRLVLSRELSAEEVADAHLRADRCS